MSAWEIFNLRNVWRHISGRRKLKPNRLVQPRLESLEDRLIPTANVWIASAVSDHNWNTAANWSLGHIPAQGEVATFGQSGSVGNNQDCTINTGSNRCDGISIGSLYTGTITMAADLGLVSAAGFAQAGGTFNMVTFTI